MLTEMETLTDMLAGFMYKQSDMDDDTTWLDSDKFHPVAEQILYWLQSKGYMQPQLDKHHVIGCKEVLELMLKDQEKFVRDNERPMFYGKRDVAKSRIKNIEAVLQFINEDVAL